MYEIFANSLIASQSLALIGAGLLLSLFWITARALAPKWWPQAMLSLIVITSSTLSWLALVNAPAAPWVVLGVLTMMAAWGATCRTKAVLNGAGLFHGPWPKIAAAALGIDFLFAVYPFYRFDQWDYHLVIAKMVSLAGPINPQAPTDLVKFSGIYEYLLLLPRLFTRDDVIIHGLSNAFTLGVVTTVTMGIASQVARWHTFAQPRLLCLPIAAIIVFSLPEHEALISAKPDFILVTAAVALFAMALHAGKKEAWDSRGALLFGLLSSSLVAFKLTWIHFATAFAVSLIAVLLTYPQTRRFFLQRATAVGLLFGAALTIPFFAKNWALLGNPVHPMQIGPFSSNFWSAAYADYWRVVASKPENLSQLFAAWLGAPWRAAQASLAFLLISGVALIEGRLIKSRINVPRQAWLLVGIYLLAAFLVWPLFYGPGTYGRFVAPVIAPLIAFMILAATRAAWPALIGVCLLGVLATTSALDVRTSRLAQHALDSRAEFFASRPPLDLYLGHTALNRAKARFFPDAPPYSVVALADTHVPYFFDGFVIKLDDFAWGILWSHFSARTTKPCLWQFLKEQNISFLFTYSRPVTAWREPFSGLVDETIPFEDGRWVRIVPEGLWEKRIASDPACH